MLTRCPNCETTFRVTPEQLKARQGKVRCGECQSVFNALETLVEEPTKLVVAPVAAITTSTPMDISVPEPVQPVPEEEVPREPTDTPDAITNAAATLPAEPATETVGPPPADEVPLAEPIEPTERPLPDLPAEPPASAEPVTESLAPTPAEVAEPLAEEIYPEEEAPPRRWSWLLGGLTAALVLLLQAGLHFRTELAVVLPETRPLLEGACDMLGCAVELPARVEFTTIESSDLQPVPDRKGLLALTATLRNRAPFAQAYPTLELSLTDNADKAMVRRILLPADYLPAGTDPARGFAPGEISVALQIDSGSLGASGYRLYLFYP